ncbi:ferredoxin--NADP reductase [Breoghania sp.]|uniref:ferredoxin--NADP reductase n=1 Tax=Breoghania sp. TaxID=2065378 RepID=UPI002AAC405C|nr:ferredoxin--NADP reductase [Breoghania sp.]
MSAPSASPATDCEIPILLGAPSPFAVPTGCFALRVTEVQHYTDRLFRFRVSRPREFRFRSGEFVMIGLPNADKPVFRAYSIASPSWDEELEFFSIKVPDGPLTEHLQKIRAGDTLLMRKKPTGTLVNDALTPGKRLWMFSTGTGIAPFASLIRAPETYEKFDTLILTHGCRLIDELKYGQDLVAALREDPLIGELVEGRLIHYPTVTREPFANTGRITDLITSGKLFEDLGLPRMGPEDDRAMICGSMAMLKDTKALCLSHGLEEGANNKPAQFVVERAFVD